MHAQTSLCSQFTTYRYGVPLRPGEQATLSYKWPIQALFEPAEFGFTLLVSYEDSVFSSLPAL